MFGDDNESRSNFGSNEVDKLDAIFDAQEKFRRIMGKGQDNIVDLMNEQQKGQLVYDHIQAIASELQELMDCIYWKSWAKEAKEGKRYMFRNIENAKEEIADIYCFLGDICAAVGMSAEELAAINIRKTEVNINRQLTKYAMDTKDGADSAAIWEQIKNGELSGKPTNENVPEKLAPKYMSDQPDKVTIYGYTANQLGDQLFCVTLASTNESKEILISGADKLSGEGPRVRLMKKISEAFNLTKPFRIEEV